MEFDDWYRRELETAGIRSPEDAAHRAYRAGYLAGLDDTEKACLALLSEAIAELKGE